MWNGEYIDGRDEEYFENMGYNQNIEPGQSQTIGFIATVIGDKVEIYNDCLYEMITIPDEYVGDPDWEEEYSVKNRFDNLFFTQLIVSK